MITPPLVVLTRPSAKKTDANPDSYGQKFIIEGQASDDSGIDLLEVEIYSKEENPKLLKTVQLKNVPLSININVAEFKDEIYTEIYGDNIEEGKKDYFCKIKAYDGTKKVPALSDDDKKGNLADSYYLYNDIYSSVLSKYKINEVYQILSGTYKEAENRAGEAESEKSVFETVKENLSKNKIDSGFFSLNPRNNPSYILSGYESLLCDGKDFSELKYHIPNGTKIAVRLQSGLDNTPLIDDTLGVSCYECDDYAKILDEEAEIVLVPALKDKDGNVLLTDENSNEFSEFLGEADKVIYADSAYVGKEIPKHVENRICEKGYRGKPLTDEQKESNRRKSKIRCRIEHVFGFITVSMHGLTVRSIGIKRAEFNIGLTNLVYNFCRYTILKRKEVYMG